MTCFAVSCELKTEKVKFSGALNNGVGDFGAQPISTLLEKTFIDKKLVSQAKVSKTDHGMRYTYHDDWINRTKQMVLLGDSNTFGWGLENNETLSYLLAKQFRDYRVYNLGNYGGGPHDVLYNLKEKGTLKKLPKSKGVMILQFFSYYYMRVIGTFNYMTWQGSSSRPWYKLNADDQLVYQGTFEDRWYSKWYERLNSLIPASLYLEFPKIGEDDIKLTFKIIERIKNIYEKEFPGNTFYVLLMPNLYSDPIHKDAKKFMNQYGIKYLEVLSLKNFKKGNRLIFNPDNHLTSEANKRIAKDIFEYIAREK